MHLLTKATLGFSVAGTTAVGTLYMGGVFKGREEKPSKTVISKLLKQLNPKKKLIESSIPNSDVVWKAAWKAYRTKNKDSKVGEDIWKLPGWTSIASDTTISEEDAPSYFVQACSSHGEQQVDGVNNDLYKEVLEFCTRYASIKDWISDSGRKVIGSDDVEGWKATWKLYLEKNKEVAKGNDIWKVKDLDPAKASNDTVIDDFKAKCTSKLELKSSDSSFDEEYQRVFEWCTK
ncbi:hypothetical protein MHC_01300 [Mycoplasma haemocanis str. Illinois]|uniref:Uncharacterized protein n=1 Tax=Mycoplasma haemocanis (strain Illinois) TaxID=1111676 RepID=H6N654_MYCHN|nr:hypothetical protein [Mycoplasma haemocanis]AEW45126.1 hypothetical protein MHC_01300 [Mycoplasma haemocanis str. Illinois]